MTPTSQPQNTVVQFIFLCLYPLIPAVTIILSANLTQLMEQHVINAEFTGLMKRGQVTNLPTEKRNN